MFALFFSLYVAMFVGAWTNYSIGNIAAMVKSPINALGEFLTSLFNNVSTPYATLGDVLLTNNVGIPNYITLLAFVLALITSIGIVVMAVKGVKKAFGIFFMGIRR